MNGGSALFNGVAGHLLVSDNALIQDVFDGGGVAGILLNATSDGEGNAGRLMDKNGWYIAVIAESGGSAKIQFTQLFSTTNGVWETTATDLTLAADDCVIVDYDNTLTTNDPVIYIAGQVIALTETSTPVGTRTTDVGSDLYIGNNAVGSATFDGRLSNGFLAPTFTENEPLQINEAFRSRYAAEVISYEPTGYWRGNAPSGTNLVDYGAEGNDGTLVNSTFANAESPLGNEAQTSMNFDGNGDYVTIPHVAAYNQSEQTYIACHKSSATPPEAVGVLYKGIDTANINRELSLASSATKVLYSVGDGSYNDVTFQSTEYAQWAQTVCVKELNGSFDDISIYRNGIFGELGTTVTGLTIQNSRPIEFGRTAENSQAGRYFEGQIAEVSVFPVALTAPQILDIYEMASYNLVTTTFGITGLITESLSATEFFVRASQLDTGSFIGDAVMQGDNTYAFDFGAIAGYETYADEVLLTALPKTGKRRLNSTAYVVGDYYIHADVTTNDHIYEVTAITTGITAASEPTLDQAGGTTVDGGVTVTDRGSCPTPQTQIDYATNF